MIRLSTIGPVTVQVGDTRVPAASHQSFAALLYLTVERGVPTPRRALMEMFFPDSPDDAASHSVRQLVYRLRKLGAGVESDQTSVALPADAASWDVDELLAREWANSAELDSLAKGYLTDFPPHSERFNQWLDQHRAEITGKIRHLLVRQIATERSQRHFHAIENVARACLALDPLNEEATLAAAESLAMAGAKVEAIQLLDRYLDDIGSRSRDLRVAPRILRERISDYAIDRGRDGGPLIGRDAELTAISALVDQSSAGATRACAITGPSGIGKTRLLAEACSLAALSGHAVIQVTLHQHDAQRPFAILRDLGPSLLDLPGAIGASPEALAAVKGLCGRGPSPYKSIPPDAFATRAVAAEVHARVIEVLDAVLSEQPIVLLIENAQFLDNGSVELAAEMIEDQRPLCVLIASTRPISTLGPLAAALSNITLAPLSPETSRRVLEALFDRAGRQRSAQFMDSACSLAGGIPFYLHLLFQNFLTTGDPSGVPESLSASISSRLEDLEEPAKSLFDAIVILGDASSPPLLATISELPKYAFIQALRRLEETGLVRSTGNTVVASHDLFWKEAKRRMPWSVAQTLHRAAASLPESASNRLDPLAVAEHWEACGESERAVTVLLRSSEEFMRLGRPMESANILERARRLACSEDSSRQIDIARFSTYRALGEYSRATAIGASIGLAAGAAGLDLEIAAIDVEWRSGRSVEKYRSRLEETAANRSAAPHPRTTAARLLAIHAEVMHERELSQKTVLWIADLDDSSPEVLKVRLIHQTGFGSTDGAIAAAVRLGEAAVDGPRPRLENLHNAAFALWRCGDSRALRLLEQGYSLSKKNKYWTACTGIAANIAALYWFAGDSEQTRSWFQVASNHFERGPSPDLGQQHFAMGVLLALEDGRPDLAEGFLSKAEAMYPIVHEGRLGLERLAYRIRIDLAFGRSVSTEQVDELLSGHLERQSAGLHDVVADTLFAVLKAQHRANEADELRHRYLSIRRDRFPPAKGLRHLNA